MHRLKTGLRLVYFLALIVSVGSLLSLQEGGQHGLRPVEAPVNPEFLSPPSPEFGWIPHPMDLSHIQPESGRGIAAPPPSFDWRTLGGVTPPKDQGGCGSCWAFAGLGDFEATILVQTGKVYDFSEENVKECNYVGQGCGGGNYFTVANYLSRQGAVHDYCDIYHAYDTGVCKTTCERVKIATQWRVLPNDTAAIKNAVMTHGPVSTTMYASFPGFSGYDGSYCLYYTGTETVNHGVMIVGWDDSFTHGGGSGGWICKNSWGTGWGDMGYFYIAYGSASIGSGSAFFEDFEYYDYYQMFNTLYHYDEGGWQTAYGLTGMTSAYGMVKFTASKDDCIQAVDFWASDDNSTYTIWIYDDFNGSALSNMMYGPHVVNCSLPGYYSEQLTTPIWIAKNDDFYVVVRGECTGYDWPICCDKLAPIETNKTYLSPDLSTFYELGAYGADVAIRVRTKNHQYVFGGHDFAGDGDSEIAVWEPTNGRWYIKGLSWPFWGGEGHTPVAGDYDGNGVCEVAVWRPFNGRWYIKGQSWPFWGGPGDIPVPADYNGDTITDVAVWRPTDGRWYIKGMAWPIWGSAGDIPVPADYDGDGSAEVAVWRPSDSTWYIQGQAPTVYGQLGDIPVPADYDGDGSAEIAVWRSTDGKWYILGSAAQTWGQAGDCPCPGDFDGNGTADVAVWRSSNGRWYIKGQSWPFWGQEGNIPVVR